MSDTRPATMPLSRGSARPATLGITRAMIVFVTLVAILYFGRTVLIPVTLALLLAFLLAPLVSLLRRAHLGRVPSILLGVLLTLGMVLALGGVIVSQFTEFTTELPRYVATVETKIVDVKTFTIGRVSQFAEHVIPHWTEAAPSPPSTNALNLSGSTAAQQFEPVLFGFIQRYLSPVLSQLAGFFIVFTVAVFALLQGKDLRNRIIRLAGPGHLQRTTLIINDETRHLRRYFFTQLSVNAAFGVVIGTGLFAIGLPNPVLWGTMSALLRFVPYVGSLLSAGLATIVAAAVAPGWSMVFWTTGLYLVVEGATGQGIEPMIYGHSTGLSPFSIVVAAIFWSWLWGPTGLLLSTPLTMCLVVLGRHVKQLEFLDVLLGDEPALTPAESFYQCLLAGNAAEVRAESTTSLKNRSLSRYYDEVAVRGLRLAAADARKGVLGPAQLGSVRNTAESLVRELGHHDDGQLAADQPGYVATLTSQRGRDIRPDFPGPSAGPGESTRLDLPRGATVVCIAGGGPFDEVASAMLMQLIHRHGMEGRLVSHDDAAHVGIEALAAAAMVCITCLDASGEAATLRQLAQRLRQGPASHTPVLIGMWPAEDLALQNPAIQAAVGADYYTSSLGQAVTACAQIAWSPKFRAGGTV